MNIHSVRSWSDEHSQLAILTTNLPVSWGSSIFLKVDETRVDIIKALITGPEGTPYVLRNINKAEPVIVST